jgi:hypothetical protein
MNAAAIFSPVITDPCFFDDDVFNARRDDGALPVTGNPNIPGCPSLIPEEAAFFGADPNGVWTPAIPDDATNAGALGSWSLFVESTAGAERPLLGC